jgi:hypothetical protein
LQAHVAEASRDTRVGERDSVQGDGHEGAVLPPRYERAQRLEERVEDDGMHCVFGGVGAARGETDLAENLVLAKPKGLDDLERAAELSLVLGQAVIEGTRGQRSRHPRLNLSQGFRRARVDVGDASVRVDGVPAIAGRADELERRACCAPSQS